MVRSSSADCILFADSYHITSLFGYGNTWLSAHDFCLVKNVYFRGASFHLPSSELPDAYPCSKYSRPGAFSALSSYLAYVIEYWANMQLVYLINPIHTSDRCIYMWVFFIFNHFQCWTVLFSQYIRYVKSTGPSGI